MVKLLILFCILANIQTKNSQKKLIESLKSRGYIHSAKVEEFMLAIDRALFVDDNPYEDSPKSIGYSVTISAPHMHATALEEMLPRLQPRARILDVGSGSGYLTACLADMVAPGGVVVGIDHIEELVNKSIQSCQKIPRIEKMIKLGSLMFVGGDGRLGYPPLAPYDAIHVGAGSEDIPEELMKQLSYGGILICPVGKLESQVLMKVTKLHDGSIKQTDLMHVRYVPLTDKRKQLRWEL